ncbi:substrate-binding domain-containing protein [Pseudarthrobacter sp. IC2-21]|uniref:substrate-binding domain-containing protein n=1 Tax=Pseudarthrobacter sp. IC2-21 TaxID=3092262 RepID=UPI002A6B8763|nr:substrate-binding domain-containing protein [Pseudarthrobacter sp. IC2-21]
MRRWSKHAVVAGGLLISVLASGCSHSNAGNEVLGALTAIGSPVQSEPIAAWSNAWRKKNTATSLNYSPDGSAVGVTALATGQAYFAALDSPLSSSERMRTTASCGPDGAFSVPVAITSLAVAFNMPSVTGLKLSPSVLGGIFSGKIRRWDNEAIVAINPGAKLPKADIVPIVATEPSALSLAATEYLASGQSWSSEKTNSMPVPENGVEVRKYKDLSQKVNDTAGAIAIMDVASIGSRFDTALLSFGGDFIRQSKDSVALANAEGTVAEDSNGVTFSLPANSSYGYPFGMVNYQAFCNNYDNEQLAKLVKSWGLFVVGSEGQIASMYFGSVSSPSQAALQKSAQRIEKIEAKG